MFDPRHRQSELTPNTGPRAVTNSSSTTTTTPPHPSPHNHQIGFEDWGWSAQNLLFSLRSRHSQQTRNPRRSVCPRAVVPSVHGTTSGHIIKDTSFTCSIICSPYVCSEAKAQYLNSPTYPLVRQTNKNSHALSACISRDTKWDLLKNIIWKSSSRPSVTNESLLAYKPGTLKTNSMLAWTRKKQGDRECI